MTNLFYVYILKCKDNSLYTGYTDSLDKRLKKHNDGKASKYTRSRLPVQMVYYEEHPDKSSAMKREIKIKSLSRENKIKLVEEALHEPII
ncbi:GIY-YIG nuclease family protein [Gudongella sp. DL1XJH-153]|uniref:GIY-YIG nuclease family protein n=1 Tax=Gudongella sp. DL1XJH-153 TaxID=3409804 RepID=UPI003BB52B89